MLCLGPQKRALGRSLLGVNGLVFDSFALFCVGVGRLASDGYFV